MKKLTICSWGGSGESGRNCFLVEYGDGAILLDCGVKRAVRDGRYGEYPRIEKAMIPRLKAVFLSHCHEDHTAALPLLYEMGYRGDVYAAEPTIRETPAFLKKWVCFVRRNGGVLPFAPAWIDRIRYRPVSLGENRLGNLRFVTGRSGHVIGGIWYAFDLGDHRLFYSGDITMRPMLLGRDTPPVCDAAIMNCAYAGLDIDSDGQLRSLLGSVRRTLREGGKVLLPLPEKGRGCDLLGYLTENLTGTSVFVEQPILDSYRGLMAETDWLGPSAGGSKNREPGPDIIPVADPDSRRRVCEAAGPAVILTPDGMLTAPEGIAYFRAMKDCPANKVIITGHAETGTLGVDIFDKSFCLLNDVRLRAEKLVIKVHLDDADVLELNRDVQAGSIVLFHSDAEKADALRRRLAEQHVQAICLPCGGRLHL